MDSIVQQGSVAYKDGERKAWSGRASYTLADQMLALTLPPRIVDGGMTTQPQASFWFRDVGFGVENYGTDPDVVVDKAPQDWAAGADPQLDRAITLVTRELKAHRPLTPAQAKRPRLPLPKRLPSR